MWERIGRRRPAIGYSCNAALPLKRVPVSSFTAPLSALLLAPLLSVAGCSSKEGKNQPAPSPPAWKLVWSDEFDQAEGMPPDPGKWSFDRGGDGWGNRELETYTDRPVNARVQGGSLLIEARRERWTGPDHLPRRYTSAVADAA